MTRIQIQNTKIKLHGNTENHVTRANCRKTRVAWNGLENDTKYIYSQTDYLYMFYTRRYTETYFHVFYNCCMRTECTLPPPVDALR